MIRNYLKIAWRNLVKNKTQTFINVAGLSLGMAVVMLIGLWIYDEVTWDKSFKNYDRIVSVMQHQTLNGEVFSQNNIPMPAGPKLKRDYMNNFTYVVRATYNYDHIIGTEE